MLGNIHVSASGKTTFHVPDIMATSNFITTDDFLPAVLTTGKIDFKTNADPTKNAASVQLLYGTHNFNVVMPRVKMPYAPTGTDYGGKAKHLSYFLPLQVTAEGELQRFLQSVESTAKVLLFKHRVKLFDLAASSMKKPADVPMKSMIYCSGKTNEDGDEYDPIFQPMLPKVYRRGGYTDEFDVECDVHRVDGTCERAVKLTVDNLENYLLPGSEIACILSFRPVRVVKDVVHWDVTVRQMDVQHKEVAGLRKGTLRRLLDAGSAEAKEDNETLHWNGTKRKFEPARFELKKDSDNDDEESLGSYEEIVYEDTKQEEEPAQKKKKVVPPRRGKK